MKQSAGEKMTQNKNEEIEKLTNYIREKGGDAVEIPASNIVTAEWVRMKCLFGCAGYGRRFGCPPYSPTPAETQKVLDEFTTALLVRFDGDCGETTPARLVSREMTRFVQTVMYDVEKTAFKDGFYKVLAYTGHQCGWCKSCAAKENGAVASDCRVRNKMRPSMEAAGIDVYATCENAGWKLDVLSCTKVEGGTVLDSPMSTIMLLLLE
ncbi:MAG: DUF2284 domain-containing protein [Methanocorpusculum sp.]|nr:DUF2284 domain-containing protein [Methanocorpusculum sp.]